MSGKYDDIIGLPHHVSSTRPHMPMIDRAAQFTPFAALSGYDAAIRETARLTDTRLELDDCEKETLNEKLRLIAESLDDKPAVAVTYFLPDKKKSGGAYVTAAGTVKKIDAYELVVVMGDGTRIPIEDIADIESEIFGGVYDCAER